MHIIIRVLPTCKVQHLSIWSLPNPVRRGDAEIPTGIVNEKSVGLHSVKFVAVKRPVAINRNWP